MLKESQSSDLQLLATRLGFSGLQTAEIQSVAHRLLNAGIYDDALLAIIDSDPPTQSEVLPPFRQYLAANDIVVPDRDAAVWTLLRHHIRRIADGCDRPHDALGSV